MRESRFQALACNISGPTWTSVNWKGREYPRLRNGFTIFTNIFLLFLIDNNWRFSQLSLFFNNVAVMLRWVRKKVPSCFGSIGSFINYNERNVICLKVGPATTSEWGSSSASLASLLTARLGLSNAKSIFADCFCKLGFSFSFGCPIVLSLDHIHVGYHSHTREILSPPGPPCSIPGLPRKLEKLSKAPQSVDSSNICVQCTLLPDPKYLTNSMWVA